MRFSDKKTPGLGLLTREFNSNVHADG